MSKLWKSSRQCLYGGSLSLQQISTITRLPRSSSSTYPPPRFSSQQPRRQLLTLAIETSCDDTCVAVLEKNGAGVASLHFNEKITSDNREYGGVHPIVAAASHTEHLGPLVQKALRALPKAAGTAPTQGGDNGKSILVDGCLRSRPDFVSVTRGPGMLSNLAIGLNLAKGLAAAWDVPLLAVNHMQAHALTPRLVGALQDGGSDRAWGSTNDETGKQGRHHPRFPFLSLLVSGGHTMLVRSRSLNDHAIIANSSNIAVGDMLDKCARMILPPAVLSAETSNFCMYGPMFEEFGFPGSKESASFDYHYIPPARRGDEIKTFDSGYGWVLTPPLANMGSTGTAAATYDFAGINGQVQKLMLAQPDMDIDMRRVLARAVMTLVFEHLTSRIVFALQSDDANSTSKTPETAAGGHGRIRTIVLSGGVASNKFLRHVVRKLLDVRGYADVELVAPPVSLCTDNAAMIAWTAMEMYEEGWRSHLSALPLRKWPLDPNAEGGGILGAGSWYKAPVAQR